MPDDASENNKTHNGAGTTVTVGTTDNLTLDFGFTPAPSTYRIGDLFWIDANNNGVYDPGEKTIGGATVELLDEDGNVIATTKTDANGRYHFDVPAGKYKVRFHIPQDMIDDGYEFVEVRKPGDETNKVLPSGVVEAAVEVGPGIAAENLTLDAAVQCACATMASDSGDALSTLGMLLMLMASLVLGFGFIRREEKHCARS